MSLIIHNELKTIQDHIRFAYSCFSRADLFYGHGTDNAWDEALQLILHSLKLPWDVDKQIWNANVTEDEKQLLQERIQLRVNKKIPVPYLVGEAWFMQLPFIVTKNVLIPRSPIAELLENEFQPWLKIQPTRILDMCTGSGCIGIAAALIFEGADVDLADISEKALEVAHKNIQRYQLKDRVTAINSDLFEDIHGKYDLIISNPPYVDSNDFTSMPEEFQAEPVLGLVSGEDGLDCTHSILKHAAEHLTEEGLLVVEVGNSWVALENHYDNVPFTWVEFEKGGHGVFILTANEVRKYVN